MTNRQEFTNLKSQFANPDGYPLLGGRSALGVPEFGIKGDLISQEFFRQVIKKYGTEIGERLKRAVDADSGKNRRTLKMVKKYGRLIAINMKRQADTDLLSLLKIKQGA